MQQQLEAWQGDFGNAYTERNVVDWQSRLPGFRKMLDGLTLSRVLEVGCNRGHNLVALSELLGPESDVVGIEPNPHALQIARQSSSQVAALRGTIYDLPFRDATFDLTMTCGVLIHVPLDDLSLALDSLYRTSRRYILCLEYFDPQETIIPYRGHDDLLWKRDFRRHYQERFPALTVIREGYWEAGSCFNDVNWWLFEKTK